MDRAELLNALKVTGGALATKEDVAPLASYFFDGSWVRTYDDEVAISTRCELPVQGGLSGRPLSAWVGACNGVEVDASAAGTDVALSCGRSKLTLGLLEPSLYALERPLEDTCWLDAPMDLLHAIDRVHGCMSHDPAHPALSGVTLKIEGAMAAVYATNNGVTMARAEAVVEANGPLEIVIPVRFVNILLSMSKTEALAALRIGKGWIEASFESETIIFSRTGSEVDVETYETVLKGASAASPPAIPIPEGLKDVFERVVRVRAATHEEHAELVIEDGFLNLSTGKEKGLGALADQVQLTAPHPDVRVNLRPDNVLPLIGNATSFSLSKRSMLLQAEGFVAVVALMRA